MDRQNTELFLESVLLIGKRMVESGAESQRAEDTVTRICEAYGFTVLNAYAVTTMVQISVRDGAGDHYTQSARVLSFSTDLGRVADLNALSRRLCAETPDVAELRRELEALPPRRRPGLWELAAYILATAAFALFFGGGILDAVAAAAVSVVVFCMDRYLHPERFNRFLYTALSSFAAGLLAVLFVRLGFGRDASAVMVGDVMLFIPTLSVVNSLREMFSRDLTTGLLRMLEALLITGAIAVGYACAILAGGVLGC